MEAAVLVATAGVGGGPRMEEVLAAEMFLSLGLADVRLTEHNNFADRSDPGPPDSQRVGELHTGAAARPGGGGGVEAVALVQHVKHCTLVAGQPGS